MEIENTRCCAVDEIADLSSHASAEEAMYAFCGELVDRGGDGYTAEDRWYDNHPGRYVDGRYVPGAEPPANLRESKAICKPSGFYTFTGVVKHTRGGQPTQNGQYAPNFAKYIIKHKLGSVVESRPAANRCNHPDHIVKVYVWHPNERNLRKWWRNKQNG